MILGNGGYRTVPFLVPSWNGSERCPFWPSAYARFCTRKESRLGTMGRICTNDLLRLEVLDQSEVAMPVCENMCSIAGLVVGAPITAIGDCKI